MAEAGAAIAVAIFTGMLWWVNSNYTWTARLAHRPWIGVLAGTGPISLGKNQMLINYLVSGGSPALETSVVALSSPKIVQEPPEDLEQWTVDTPPHYPACHEDATRTPRKTGPSLPGIAYEYRDTPFEVSADDFTEIAKGNKTIILVGCIAYRDDRGDEHFTDFCLRFLRYQNVPVPVESATPIAVVRPPSRKRNRASTVEATPPATPTPTPTPTVPGMFGFCPYGNKIE